MRLSEPKPEGKFMVLKASLITIAIVLVARDIWLSEFHTVLHFVVVHCLLWAFHRVVPTYKISEEGIAYQDGTRRLKHNWSNIDWYHISPVEAAPHLLRIQFSVKKTRGTNFPPAFVFDPREVNRNVISRIVEKHLPQSELQFKCKVTDLPI